MYNSSDNKPLPDITSKGLKLLFIGYNPGILSAQIGHHYAHKSNRFWRLLHESGLTPYRFNAEEDRKLLELGFGSTNIVDRPSTSANDIKRRELIEGSENLYKLIKEIKPNIACYVGIGVYRAFASNILNISISSIKVTTGLQKESLVKGTLDYVCSNPSGLNTIPYHDQLKCFSKLNSLIQ